MMPKKTVYAEHIAPEGHFVTGVPSRDLSEEEWNKIDEGKRKKALKLNLFKIVSRAPVKESAEEENDG
jgi:hypothetical protein